MFFHLYEYEVIYKNLNFMSQLYSIRQYKILLPNKQKLNYVPFLVFYNI